jgi:hypothetical protein
MKRHFFSIFLGLILLGCYNNISEMETDSMVESNLSEEVMADLSWLNEPESFQFIYN